MTSNSLTTQSAPLPLHFREVNKIELIAGDTADDRYLTTLADMAEACRRKENLDTWKGQFEDFLGHIHKWCREKKADICGAYLAPGSSLLKLFITTKGKSYRFDLDDPIVDLELDLHRIYPMCPLEALQMPDASQEALMSFFSPDNSFQVYGKSSATPQ